MQISPIQQTQYQTADPSFQKLRGVEFVENTVRADGKTYVLKANKFFDAKYRVSSHCILLSVLRNRAVLFQDR